MDCELMMNRDMQLGAVAAFTVRTSSYSRVGLGFGCGVV